MFQRIRDDRCEKIDIDGILKPDGLLIMNLIPQNITFTAEYFIMHVLTLFHQPRMLLSQESTRRKLNLHFHHLRCSTARYIIEEMTKLKCKRIAHPLYSFGFAVCDFYLFSRRNDKLHGFHADDNTKLLREVQEIVTTVD